MNNYDDPVYREMVDARISMLFNKPFWGRVALALDLKDATEWCSTAATDGRNLFYNREFIKKLNRNQKEFLCAHEILHCVLGHLSLRRGSRDPKLWNMANDYIINATLKSEGFNDMPEGGLYDPQFNEDMTSEEVYDILKKNSVTIQIGFDEHLEVQPGGDGSGQGDGQGDKMTVTVTGKNGPPVLTEEDVERIRNDMKLLLIRVSQQVDAGKAPAGIRRLLQDLIEPKMDWRALLDQHLRSSLKDDFTYQRINRRAFSNVN